MSVEAITWAKGVRTGNVATKALLLVLADHADVHWTCFPGQQRLSDETELPVRTLRRHLAALEARGLISRRRRFRSDGTRTSDGYLLRGPVDTYPDEEAQRPDWPVGAEGPPANSCTDHRPSFGRAGTVREPSGNPPYPPQAGGVENPSRCTRHRRRRGSCHDCQLPPLPPVPDQCGECDPNRWLVDANGLPYAKCPRCHPSVVRTA